MATEQVFRVTTYLIPSTEFSGKQCTLNLRHTLATDYFTMVQWGIDNAGDTPSADVGVQITGDPYGTGDLTQTNGNSLLLSRGTSTQCAVAVQVVVVECLRDQDGAGFRLRDVQVTSLPAAGVAGIQTILDTSTWVDPNKVVPFAGFKGGGISASSAANTEQYIFSLGVRVVGGGAGTLVFTRNDPSGAVTVLASITTYVVEWGHEWTVDHVTCTGTNTGATLDNPAMYSTQALNISAQRANTWIWAIGYTDGVGAGDCFAGIVTTLGNGVAQNASESTVAVGNAQALAVRSVEIYVLQHAQLATTWAFKAAAAGSGSQSIAVSASVGTESYLSTDAPLYVTATEGRLAHLQASVPSGNTNELGQVLITARPTASAVVTATMADPGPSLAWVGWLQVADFARVVVQQGGLPTIRSTTYRISGASFNGLTLDLKLIRPLQPDYFVMIIGTDPSAAAPDPFISYAWVAQDPYGTGDLAVSANSYTLRIQRALATNPWQGEIVVVECLRGSAQAGFRLVDVRTVGMPIFADTGIQVVNDNANARWQDLNRVVVMAGHRGGGVQPVGAMGAADIQGFGVVAVPTGTSGLQLARYTNSATACLAAIFTCYVLEFGSEWQVQQLVVQGTAGGADVNATGEFNTFYLDTAVDPTKTMVWGSFTAEAASTDSCWLSPVMALGDGVVQAASEQRVSVGLWQPNAFFGCLYVLSHASLSVYWKNQATTGVTTILLTISSPVRSDGFWAALPATTAGSRWALGYTASSSASATPDVPGAILSPRVQGYTGLRVTRDRSEGNWTGWFQAIDAGGIYTASSAVQVADDDALAMAPVQYLLLQDPQYDGSQSLIRCTSQGGRAAGPVDADTSNLGSVVGVLEGTPSDDTELSFRLRGGAVGGSGGWVYRKTTETTSADWKALNALTALWRQDGVTTTDRFSGHDIAYSTRYRRVLVAYIKSTTEIRIYYKSTDVVGTGGWSYVSIVTSDNANPANAYCGLGMEEAPDGTISLVYQQEDQVTHFYNITTYSSTDGGILWTRVASRILNKATNGSGALGNCQGQHQFCFSGDWARCAYLYQDSTGVGAGLSNLYTIVSPDRAVSWKSAGILVTFPWKAPAGYPGGFPIAMVGVGDASGTFLLAYLPSIGSQTVAVAIAARDEEWERNTALDIDISSYATTARLKGACFVRAPDRIWLYLWVEGADASDLIVMTIDPRDPANANSWTTLGVVTGYKGVMRFGPHQMRGVWAGHRLILSAGLHDPDVAAGADPVVAGHWMMQAGAYDPKPWDYTQEDSTYNNYLISGFRLVSYQWQPCLGDPAGGGGNSDALTPWAKGVTAGGTAVWDKGAGVTFTGAVAADAAFHRLALGVPGADDRWGAASANRGWCWHLNLQATGQRILPHTGEDMGVHIKSLKDAGANGYDYTLRVGTTAVVLYDNNATSILMNIPTSDLTSACEVRITQWDTKVWVAWRKVTDGPLGQWTQNGSYTVQVGALLGQSITIGVLAAVGAGTNSVLIWQDFAISYRTDAGQRGDLSKPIDMVGTKLNREPVLVANGLRVRWGGSGASDQDTFTGRLDFLRGQQNLSLDSPRYYWESSSLVQQELLFESDTRGSNPRWQINSLLLVGTVDRTCTLQFSNTDTAAAWAAPAAQVELDATLYSDLTVISVDGSAVQLVGATGSTFAPRRGELVGCYLRFTQAGVATGVTFQIVNDQGASGTGRWLLCAGAVDLPSLGVMPGAKAAVFADRMVYLGDNWSRYHYFRLLFPDLSVVEFSLGTATSTHRLGALVPGFWVKLDPPLDWTLTDNEQPNVTEYRTKGGAGWQYEEGPAQRILKGTVVGDVSESRLSLREVLREFHGYSVRPVGLLMNSLHISRDTLIYGRWTSGGQLDQAGWYKDSAGVWRPLGDIDLLVTEEL